MTTDTKTTIKRATVRNVGAFAAESLLEVSIRLDFGASGEYDPAKDAVRYAMGKEFESQEKAEAVAKEFRAEFGEWLMGQTVFVELGEDETLRRLYRYSAPDEWFTLADMLSDAENGCVSL